jgi:hypothetical protein
MFVNTVFDVQRYFFKIHSITILKKYLLILARPRECSLTKVSVNKIKYSFPLLPSLVDYLRLTELQIERNIMFK